MTVYSKRCTRCGERKTVNLEDSKASDFPLNKRTLVGGVDRYYAKGECKECKKKMLAAWKERKRQEMGEEAFAALTREYNRRSRERDIEAYRRRNREYWRKNYGKGIRVWKKYEDEDDVIVDAAPFVEWWASLREKPTCSEIAEFDGKYGADTYQRMFHRLMSGEQKTISLLRADAIMSAARQPHMTSILYPAS